VRCVRMAGRIGAELPRIMLPGGRRPIRHEFARDGGAGVVRNAAPSGGVRNSTGAVPTERKLIGIVSELRRLNRTIAAPLERDLKRAGCPSLETYEVLRVIEESGDVPLRPVQLQTRLALPQHKMSRLID